MGLLPALRAAHVGRRLTTRLDAAGEVRESVRSADDALRVRRGDLLAALRAPLEGRVEFLTGDSVATLDDDGDAVHVAFDSGDFRTYDLVIGAEGPHSNTRRLVFGPERPFHHYHGQVFAGFSLPNDFGLAHETVVWEAPGRRASLTAYGPGEPAHACLTLTREDPPYTVFGDPWAQRELVRGYFPEQVWQLPVLVREMWRAQDLHVDVVGEIRIRAWSHERVALVGDAAWGGSLLAGEGRGRRWWVRTYWGRSWGRGVRTVGRSPGTRSFCAGARRRCRSSGRASAARGVGPWVGRASPGGAGCGRSLTPRGSRPGCVRTRSCPGPPPPGSAFRPPPPTTPRSGTPPVGASSPPPPRGP
ncbi:hypothetical protein GA0115246_105701 [Streptomyces sp. SolWspMP-sol7th]|nr:hypothetical protein GA0115246_105701 [Streptomyces sp. SolWspMP-sol7th]